MSVQKMLEYQKIDLNIYKKEKALAQSDEMKLMVKCKATVKSKKESLSDLLSELDKCYAILASLDGKFSDYTPEKASLDSNLGDFTDIKQFDHYEANLKKYEDNVANFGKEIAKVLKRISDIAEANKTINDQINRLILEFNRAKAATEEKRKELLKEAVPFAKQLKELEVDIEPELLAQYKEIRQKKMPVYVPYSDGSCLGCGMGISVEVDKLLIKPFDSTECPHCGRIVYKLS